MLSNLFDYDHGTILLYCFIVLFSTLLARISKKRIIYNSDGEMIRTYDKHCFFLCFIFVAFFAATNGVGADKPMYAYFFSTSSFDRIFAGSEPGYEIFMWLSRFVINDSNVFLSLFGLFTVVNVFWGIWKLKDKISIPWAVFIFTSQYYFQGFNLMRMYFAVSLLILFAHYIDEGKYIKYGVAILIAATFHYSMLFVLVAYVMSFVFNRLLRGNFGFKVVVLSILSIVFSTVAVRGITRILVFSNAVIYKYVSYLSDVSLANPGLKWIFNIIPFVFALIFMRMLYQGNLYMSITVSYFMFSLVISLLSYSVPVIGRALIGFNLPILILLPMVIERFQMEAMSEKDYSIYISFGRKTLKVYYRFMKMVMIVYFVFAYILYLSEYMGIDKIDNFKFLWA